MKCIRIYSYPNGRSSNLELDRLKQVVEALIFTSGDGLTAAEIAAGLNLDAGKITMVADSLVDDYLERESGIHIDKVKGRYSFRTSKDVYEEIKDFIRSKKSKTLTKSMMETLTIIAYKQPVTVVELEEIRGVNTRTMISALTAKKLIKTLGKKEAPGKPTMYGTTREFLEYLGINSLEDLPSPQEIKEMNFEEL